MKYIARRPIDWFGPYHLLDPLEKLLMKCGHSEDRAYEVISSIVEYIPNKPFELIHKFRQKLPWNRTVIKIDYWDTWSMKSTLAPIILPMLKQLKETKHGIPCEFADVGGESYASQLCFDFYSQETNQLFNEKAVARWNEVMDKMIWSFEQLTIDEDADTEAYWEPYWEDMTDEEAKIAKLEKSNLYELIGVDHPLKKINVQKMNAYYDRVREGFELFGKYYQNLWD